MAGVEILPHDLAVLAALEVIDRPVGFAAAPDGALEALRSAAGPHEYVIVYPISGLRSPNAINDATGDVSLVYQTTVVARLPEGARWAIDQIESALLAVTVTGRHVVRITPDEVGDVRPDFDLLVADDQPVFYATPRWRLWTTPA